MKSAESLAMLADRSAENRTVIAQSGAIPALVQLLGDGRNVNKTQVRAAAALSDLAKASENKRAIVSAGGIRPLVTMLTSSSVEAQTRASGTVAPGLKQQRAKLIANADGISLLVKLLSSERHSCCESCGLRIMAPGVQH